MAPKMNSDLHFDEDMVNNHNKRNRSKLEVKTGRRTQSNSAIGNKYSTIDAPLSRVPGSDASKDDRGFLVPIRP